MQERTARAVGGAQQADGGRERGGDDLPLLEWELFAGLVGSCPAGGGGANGCRCHDGSIAPTARH